MTHPVATCTKELAAAAIAGLRPLQAVGESGVGGAASATAGKKRKAEGGTDTQGGGGSQAGVRGNQGAGVSVGL